MCSVALALGVVGVLIVGCSRKLPPPEGASSSRTMSATQTGPAEETGSAKLQLATKVEETADAGAAPESLSGKSVLHVGDSMVGGNFGLTKALEARFTGEGAKFVRDYKVSESIVSFDHSPKLKELIAKNKPDIVIITLGTNDVFVPYPQAMAPNVKSIVGRIGNRECYWMGPPTWKPDTGIVQVLRDNVAPCKFYDSSNLKLQRAGDGIHPTDHGGADWATSFWSFFRPTAVLPADAGVLPSP